MGDAKAGMRKGSGRVVPCVPAKLWKSSLGAGLGKDRGDESTETHPRVDISCHDHGQVPSTLQTLRPLQDVTLQCGCHYLELLTLTVDNSRVFSNALGLHPLGVNSGPPSRWDNEEHLQTLPKVSPGELNQAV